MQGAELATRGRSEEREARGERGGQELGVEVGLLARVFLSAEMFQADSRRLLGEYFGSDGKRILWKLGHGVW